MSVHAPRALKAYVAVLTAAGAGLLLVALYRLGVGSVEILGDLGGLPLAASVAGAAFLAELAPARLRTGLSVSVVTVVVFAAILLGGWAVAVIAPLGIGLATGIRNDERAVQKALFNFGQMSIAAFAAAQVYRLGVGGAPTPPMQALQDLDGLAALAVTSVTLTAVNMALVAGVVWCMSGESPWETVSGFAGSAGALQLVYVLLAVVAAALVTVNPLALVLLLVPLMVARAGLLGFQEQDEATDRMVKSFVKALEVKDGYTRGHSQRVAELTEKVAAEMGFGFNERRMAGYAALLHDIGKIGVPTAIITKRGSLDDDEFAAIKRHPTVGAEMLRDIDFLVPALDVVRHHHERFDGRGYPHGLSGERIPRLARMVSVVDAFDAMTSTRSYRTAMGIDVALEELDRCAGTQFDPEAVTALKTVIAREGWELTTEEVHGPVVSRAGQVRALAREVAG